MCICSIQSYSNNIWRTSIEMKRQIYWKYWKLLLSLYFKYDPLIELQFWKNTARSNMKIGTGRWFQDWDQEGPVDQAGPEHPVWPRWDHMPWWLLPRGQLVLLPWCLLLCCHCCRLSLWGQEDPADGAGQEQPVWWGLVPQWLVLPLSWWVLLWKFVFSSSLWMSLILWKLNKQDIVLLKTVRILYFN